MLKLESPRSEAELHRLKGELLLALSPDNHVAVETCFHHALTIARHQEAKSLELRAATSLCRLWQRQGKPAAARALLTPIYGWFTEGFDTADLLEAKALLEDLDAWDCHQPRIGQESAGAGVPAACSRAWASISSTRTRGRRNQHSAVKPALITMSVLKPTRS